MDNRLSTRLLTLIGNIHIHFMGSQMSTDMRYTLHDNIIRVLKKQDRQRGKDRGIARKNVRFYIQIQDIFMT